MSIGKRVFVSLVAVCCILGVGFIVFCHIQASYIYYPKIKEHHRQVDKHLDLFVEDIEFISKSEYFGYSKRESNFHDLFLDHLGPSTSNTGIGPGMDSLCKKVKAKYFQKNVKAIDLIVLMKKDPDIKKINVNWIDKAFEYDHWDSISGDKTLNSKIKKISTKNNISKIAFWSQIPVPATDVVRFVSMIRSVQLIQTSKPEKAIKLLKHLSNIYLNSMTLVGGMVAVSNLKLGNDLVDFLQLDKNLKTSENYIHRLKRSTWAWPGVLRRFELGDVPEKIIRHIKKGSPACLGVFETNTGILGYSDFLGGQFPFEFNFRRAMEKEKKRRKKWFEVCDLQVFDPWLTFTAPKNNPWINKDFSMTSVGVDSDSIPFSINSSRLPYVRSVMGMIMYSIAMPGFMRLYQEESLN